MEIGKKSGRLDAGYVWAPYVMAEKISLDWVAQRRTSLIRELWGFTSKEEDNVSYPKMGVKSRYATANVNNRFYGTIEINKKAD